MLVIGVGFPIQPDDSKEVRAGVPQRVVAWASSTPFGIGSSPQARADALLEMTGDEFIEMTIDLNAATRDIDPVSHHLDGVNVKMPGLEPPPQAHKPRLLEQTLETAKTLLGDAATVEEGLVDAAMVIGGATLMVHPFSNGNGRTARMFGFALAHGIDDTFDTAVRLAAVSESGGPGWQVAPTKQAMAIELRKVAAQKLAVGEVGPRLVICESLGIDDSGEEVIDDIFTDTAEQVVDSPLQRLGQRELQALKSSENTLRYAIGALLQRPPLDQISAESHPDVVRVIDQKTYVDVDELFRGPGREHLPVLGELSARLRCGIVEQYLDEWTTETPLEIPERPIVREGEVNPTFTVRDQHRVDFLYSRISFRATDEVRASAMEINGAKMVPSEAAGWLCEKLDLTADEAGLHPGRESLSTTLGEHAPRLVEPTLRG